MNPAVLGAIVTILVAIGTFLGIYVTTRGNRKTKEIEARTARESLEASKRKEDYDQVQEDLTDARREARELRAELQSQRGELNEMQTKLAEVRAQAERQMADMRTSYRQQAEADEIYIGMLIEHINTRREPPAPGRPGRPG